MINLSRLPPSKHVLWLSTPLISKIKNNFRAMEELKHKFREVFKPLKINVSRKYFLTTFISVSPVLLAFIAESKPSRLDHEGIGLDSNFG
jgi:hypothetical protein